MYYFYLMTYSIRNIPSCEAKGQNSVNVIAALGTTREPIMWVTYLGTWMTICLGKSCLFGLRRVPFDKCFQFMYLLISLLVFRTWCGIWLYQFLIIAYLFASKKKNVRLYGENLLIKMWNLVGCILQYGMPVFCIWWKHRVGMHPV